MFPRFRGRQMTKLERKYSGASTRAVLLAVASRSPHQETQHMWFHSYTAPVVVLLACCAIGLGLVEFHYRTDSTVNDTGPGQSMGSDAAPQENAEKAGAPAKSVGQGIDNLQQKLTADLEQV